MIKRSSIFGRRSCAVAALVVVGLAAGAATGQDLLDRVVAVVDQQPILASELEAQLAMAAEAFKVDPADSVRWRQLRQEVLEQQIDQRVIYLEAQAQDLSVDENEVEQLVEQAIGRNVEDAGSPEAFRVQLGREGLTETELRQRYREQARMELLVSRLIQREVRGDITVTEEEVRVFFDENRGQLPQREGALHLQRIVVQVQPDPALYQKALELAHQVRGQVVAGSLEFADAARRYSDDPNGRSGGDLHRVQRGDFTGRLGAAFEDSLFALAAGEIGGPWLTPLGYHLVKVAERGPAGDWAQASHILFGVPVVQADRARAEEVAEELHRRILAGESFEALAETHSDDPLSRDKGGDLGWLPAGALNEPLRASVEALEVGQISRPIPGPGEIQIFKLLGREAGRDFAFEEIKDELTELARNRKLEERYRAWLDELKEAHYIERRPLDAG